MRNAFLILLVLFSLLFGCNSYQLPVQSEASLYRMDRSLGADTSHSVGALIAPYKKELDAQMGEIIGHSDALLTKDQPESTLGNWMADATQTQAVLLSTSTIDASFQNYGGIRIPELAAGKVQLGKIYELMPFDNMLVIVEMNGKTLQLLFDQMATDGGWPVSKEVSYRIRNGKAMRLMISNKTVDKNQVYHIAMPDYIANGNNGCEFLLGLEREDTGVLIRDLLIKEVKERQQAGEGIHAAITGRVL